MLHLVDSNKAGRNFNNECNTNWKALFRSSEDSFTSSIFGLLFYLPSDVLWEILKDSIFEIPEIASPGRLLEYEFWPSWKNELGSRCEPDIFLRFEEFDLIVEAKRYDRNQQYIGQWENELQAYHNSIVPKRNLFLLAIGGIWDHDRKSSTIAYNEQECIVLKCKWTRLLQTVGAYKVVLERNAEELQDFSQLYILNDLLLAFRIHGFQTGSLFDTMPLDISLSKKTDFESLSFSVPIQLIPIPNIYKFKNYLEYIQLL